MECSYYAAGVCRSCSELPTPYDAQLAAKDRHCRDLLAGHPDLAWLPPVASAEAGFRNKAKMVVAGTLDEPTLGILDPRGSGVDLRLCPLYSDAMHAVLERLAALVRDARVPPYDVSTRRGELKHVLVTESPDGEHLVRFVLRSTEAVPRIRKRLPSLLADLPGVAVVSANLQPEHKAVLEGAEEVVLTERATLPMRVNGLTLHLRTRSFFQTSTTMAAALYREAVAWTDDLAPSSVLDLYCGVGGFALHLARPGRRVHGVEVSEEAVISARAGAAQAGLDATFDAGDATAQPVAADLVVVNPPRRGIGADLAARLEASTTRAVLYSSCNATTLARDLEAMPSLRPVRARVFDMFPHTPHHEVLVMLTR